MDLFYTKQSIYFTYADFEDEYLDYDVYACEEDELGNPSRTEQVFKGRAYRLPDEAQVIIDVTDVIRPILTPVSIDGTMPIQSNRSIAVFEVYANEVSKYFTVVYDNDPFTEGSEKCITSRVIRNTLGVNAPLIVTGNMVYDEQTSEELEVVSNPDRSYSKVLYNTEDFYLYWMVADNETHVDVSYSGDGTSESYEVVSVCDQPTLYWQNSIGGISQCLMNSHYNLSLEGERKEMTRTVRKTSPSMSPIHHKVSYMNEGGMKYVLNTPLLSDSEMDSIKDIAWTNKAWLYVNGTMVPVNITDTSVKVKKFKTDRMFNLTINCEYADSIIQY